MQKKTFAQAPGQRAKPAGGIEHIAAANPAGAIKDSAADTGHTSPKRE